MARADGVLEHNAVSQMRLSRRKRAQKPKAPRKRLLWTPAHEQQFLAAASAHELGALWLLLAHRGLRIGEARALHWDGVDFDAGVVSIVATLYYVNRTRWQRVATKNEAGTRIVPLNDALYAALLDRKAAALHCLPSDFVFAWPDGALPADETWRNWLIKLCKDAKVPRITAHQLRHLAVTRMAEVGVGVDVRQVAFGHASAAMNEHYTHVLDDRVAAAFARMDAAAAQTPERDRA